jgi:hypothetical protein
MWGILNQGEIVVCNNKKGMPFNDLWDLKAEVALAIDEDAAQDIIQAMDNADVALIQTMRGNMDGFTEREVKDTCAAHKAQAMLGHPNDHKFLGMVRNNMITSCPVTPITATNSHTIFGPDLVLV